MRILRISAAIVGVQALGLLALAVFALIHGGPRPQDTWAAAGFSAAYGAGLGACAWGLWHARRWSRGPVLLSELLLICIAISTGRPVYAVAVPIVSVCVVALAGIVHPRSTAALESSQN